MYYASQFKKGEVPTIEGFEWRNNFVIKTWTWIAFSSQNYRVDPIFSFDLEPSENCPYQKPNDLTLL